MPDLPTPPRFTRITVDVPEDKEQQFHALWLQILSDEQAPVNQQVRAAAQERAEILEQGGAALHRLFERAQGDTGQCAVVARLLAGLYNGSRFPFVLTDLRRLDDALFEEAMAVLRMDARHCVQEVHEYFDNGGRRFEAMIAGKDLVGVAH